MDWPLPELPEWKRVSRTGAGLCLFLYLLFFVYAFLNTSGFLFLDFANLMIHEAGHVFFGWGGNTLMLLGGTLGELLVPALCAAAFFVTRQPYGYAFSVFWFFDNFLYIGTYMADARTSALPLVNSDESDWTLLFGQWRILQHDQTIGHFMRHAGWLGMFSAVAWLVYRAYRSSQPELRPLQL